MPFLIPLAAVIGSAIVSAITIVAAAIGPIIAAIGAAVATVAAVLGAIVTPIVTAVITGLTWFGSAMVIQVTSLVNWITTHSKIVYTWVSGYVSSVSSTFKAILEAIHFKTILKIHSIASIVSPQYRTMMKRVYAAIGQASEALGLGPMFLTLAIQNTRNLVLDVTAMFGQKYDLGQVSWLATLNNYLNHFNTQLSKYANNPEAVFWDLAELIERPAQDAKGSFQQSIISGLDTALDFAKRMGDGLHAIGVDIETLYSDLPQFVKNQVPDPGEVFWDNFNGFLEDWYRPTIANLSNEISAWNNELTEAQTRVSSLVDRLRKPGDLVKAVDQLPTTERREQEDILAEITNRRLMRLVLDLQPRFTFDDDKLDSMGRQPMPPTWTPPVLSYEPVSAAVPGVGGVAQRLGWAVGDY